MLVIGVVYNSLADKGYGGMAGAGHYGQKVHRLVVQQGSCRTSRLRSCGRR